MSETTSHHTIEPGSDRNFGLIFAGAFSLIALWPLVHGHGAHLWAFGVAAVFCLLALVAPKVLAPINRLWFRFGMLLGSIVSPVVMTLVFAIAIVPTGAILRLLGKDVLELKRSAERESYWEKRTEQPGSMKNQF